MAKRAVRRRTKRINPSFNIPEGVDELAYDEDASDAANITEALEGEVEFPSDSDSAEPPMPRDPPITPIGSNDGRPPAPQVLGIVKQTVRTLPNGDERVDVVLHVENILGVDKYEFRISKA